MELKSIVETILFVRGEPMSLENITRAAKAEKEKVSAALEELEKEYQDRGLVLLKKEDSYQLGSHPANTSYVEDLVKDEFSEGLSRAGLETAAIIAYKGSLTRAEIEYIRGVNSSFILRNLLMRGLIERMENPKDARSHLYRISFGFLKHLGLSRPEDLPRFAEFKNQKIELAEGSQEKES